MPAKLGRNPFSTIKLSHEDGRPEAAFLSLQRPIPPFRAKRHCGGSNFEFIAARARAMYQKGLDRARFGRMGRWKLRPVL
jgi:hypothetical protein